MRDRILIVTINKNLCLRNTVKFFTFKNNNFEQHYVQLNKNKITLKSKNYKPSYVNVA